MLYLDRFGTTPFLNLLTEKIEYLPQASLKQDSLLIIINDARATLHSLGLRTLKRPIAFKNPRRRLRG